VLFWRLLSKKPRVKRKDALLQLLSMFRNCGKETVSLAEFQTAILDWQRKVPLGYQFSNKFLYSGEVFDDIAELEYGGEVLEVSYRHDSLLPKTFLKLSLTGLGRGKPLLQKLSEDERMALQEAVTNAFRHYDAAWHLWARPTREKGVPDQCAYSSQERTIERK
jgi:hypothetical protein